jgi:2-hydroxycyclohexanecarboxyl-CoA dehydrogenase
MMDMKGMVALVPGANGGIGSRVARVLAECGCDVALTYNSAQDEAKEALEHARSLGRRARLDKVDATNFDAATAWVNDVVREYGRADVLASCVGLNLSQGFTLFTELPPSEWRRHIDIQMMAFINLAHAALKPMLAQKSGRIMTIGSDSGKVGQSGACVATAAHGGLIAFSKSLAREVGRSGITVNVVCPGPTEGPKLDRLRSHGSTGSKIVEEMIRRIPMKRAGSPDEVAATMAFLASKEGGYITGQAISVSGGLTMN